MIKTAAALASVVLMTLIPSVAPADDQVRRLSPRSGRGRDPYYPRAGHGGDAVEHYDLHLSYVPATDRLRGVARIEAAATQDLSAFNLDLEGLTVRSVHVNRRPATWSREGGELTVTPQRGLLKNRTFITVVRYG